MKRIGLLCLFLVGCVADATDTSVVQDDLTIGDSTVFAHVDSPFFPEGLGWAGSNVYTSTPGTIHPTAGTGPSVIKVYDRQTGAFVRQQALVGQDLSKDHTIAAMAFDSVGRLYQIDTQRGIRRFDAAVTTESAYTPAFPDLPVCNGLNAPCSPNAAGYPDMAAFPNDLAAGPDGSFYVTDTNQATIWRVPPGGGTPVIWFQSARINGDGLAGAGPNGIRIDPTFSYVYFNTTMPSSDPSYPAGLYRLPLVAAPTDADLTLVHAYGPFEFPDGVALGESGTFYVALGLVNQISVLNSDGTERQRFGGIATDPNGGLPVNYDAPANIVFLPGHKTFVFSNASQLGPTTDAALISVYAGENGAEPFRPTEP